MERCVPVRGIARIPAGSGEAPLERCEPAVGRTLRYQGWVGAESRWPPQGSCRGRSRQRPPGRGAGRPRQALHACSAARGRDGGS